MRTGLNAKRSRNFRQNVRKPHGYSRSQTFDSSGPDVKLRGSASQIFEKYLALARDATASGDRITAENYLQHAEHYYRLINANGSRQPHTPSDDNNASGEHGPNGRGDAEQPEIS
jgi:hypothetical protein